MTSTALRTRGIRRQGARRDTLQQLAQAGGSMTVDDFRRVLATIYGSPGSVSNAFNNLRDLGFCQHRVHLTASGSALLAKTAP